MDRTVREHILELQGLTTLLTADLIHARRAKEQQQIEAKLRAIDAALSHFRSALEIESLLRDAMRAEATA
jgi:hypothetical protein